MSYYGPIHDLMWWLVPEFRVEVPVVLPVVAAAAVGWWWWERRQG